MPAMPALPPINETAERILQEAWVLFQAKGYRGVSVDEICQQSKITKPTLYYYFRNKEDLYFQMMLRRLRGYRSILEGNAPLSERLEQLCEHILSQFRVSVQTMLRDMDHIHEESYRVLLNQAFQSEFLVPIAYAMQEGITSGILRPGSSELYAWLYLGIINTFVGESHLPDAATLIDMFLCGVGQQDACNER